MPYFGYLAATRTLYVDDYPKINDRVEVHATDRFMTGLRGRSSLCTAS
ncbi:hypothetical protein [Spongiactinospora sp. TRM90649]|nr:hypothetical protein [Spongiactinospora sp. TRM90649]MDF5758402.1 hypothetical protein [Spongiactinospora sp. TRM90649]